MNRVSNGRTREAIDRDSYEPAYAQLVRILTAEIAGGVYRAGDQLPSESQLRPALRRERDDGTPHD